jgi:hypothetical protein
MSQLQVNIVVDWLYSAWDTALPKSLPIPSGCRPFLGSLWKRRPAKLTLERLNHHPVVVEAVVHRVEEEVEVGNVDVDGSTHVVAAYGHRVGGGVGGEGTYIGHLLVATH